MLPKNELAERLQQIKMVIIDVDGVMTDGGIYLGVQEELKRFNCADGAGVKYLIRNEITVAIITGRDSEVVNRRAEELGVTEVHQGAKKKLPVFLELLKRHNLKPEEVAYIGDDLIDLPLIRRVGIGFCVANASEDVKKYADYVTNAPGGQGAIREVAELILKTQNKWSQVVNGYLEQ